jgi:hypothetical protein
VVVLKGGELWGRDRAGCDRDRQRRSDLGYEAKPQALKGIIRVLRWNIDDCRKSWTCWTHKAVSIDDTIARPSTPPTVRAQYMANDLDLDLELELDLELVGNLHLDR